MPIGALADQGQIFLSPGGFLSYKKSTTKSTACFTSKLSKVHHRELLGPLSRNLSDLPKLRNQEKGVLAKGVSAEFTFTPKETEKYLRILGPAARLALRVHSQERRVFLQKPPSNRESSQSGT